MFQRGYAACTGPCRQLMLEIETEFLIFYPTVHLSYCRTGLYNRANNELYTQNKINHLV